jgi:hypothetical protein
MPENMSCQDGGSSELALKSASGSGPSKDDALFDLMSKIIADAAAKKKHSCDDKCETGINFCYTTVTFAEPTKIQYVETGRRRGSIQSLARRSRCRGSSRSTAPARSRLHATVSRSNGRID